MLDESCCFSLLDERLWQGKQKTELRLDSLLTLWTVRLKDCFPHALVYTKMTVSYVTLYSASFSFPGLELLLYYLMLSVA